MWVFVQGGLRRREGGGAHPTECILVVCLFFYLFIFDKLSLKYFSLIMCRSGTLDHPLCLPDGASLNTSVPCDNGEGATCIYSQCEVYTNYSHTSNTTETCPDGWTYSDEIESIATEVKNSRRKQGIRHQPSVVYRTQTLFTKSLRKQLFQMKKELPSENGTTPTMPVFFIKL